MKMKAYISVLMVLAVLIQGCTTEKTAYRVVGSLAISVNVARKGWNDYARAGHATAAQVQKVADAYDKYALAMSAAESAVVSYKSGAIDRTALQKALDAVSAASADILVLINQFQQL